MTQQPLYGPHNPHPLSQMRTELVWEGKYDEYGQRREVDIARMCDAVRVSVPPAVAED